MEKNILEIKNLNKTFPATVKTQPGKPAVKNVSLSIAKGEILGLVGESGCGKTTLSRLVLQLSKADSGQIRFKGMPLASFSRSQRRYFRRSVRSIFQNPAAVLNPGMKIKSILKEVYQIHDTTAGKAWEQRTLALFQALGLSASHLERYPHELSSGQQKRVGFARAFAVPPQLLLADEPFAGIDASRITQLLNFIRDAQEKNQLSILLISHDLHLVKQLADRIAVMYNGEIVELAERRENGFQQFVHPYSQKLFAAYNFTG